MDNIMAKGCKLSRMAESIQANLKTIGVKVLENLSGLMVTLIMEILKMTRYLEKGHIPGKMADP
jgi:hypothetical protein